MQIKEWLQNSPLPKLEARMLLQKATGLSRSQLISRDDRILTEVQLADLQFWQLERLDGRPMAYIMGEREFYGRMFGVSDSVLIPRPETEHLIEAALGRIPVNRTVRIWDLGTGSGIIAITLKLERPLAQVYASDLSEKALVVAKKNAESLGTQIHFARGSWFDALEEQDQKEPFDIIVSNPPYVDPYDLHLGQGDVRFEPKMALTDFDNGLSHFKQIIEESYARLSGEGWLLMEHGFDQKVAIQEMLSASCYQNISTITDLAGLDRLTIAQKI